MQPNGIYNVEYAFTNQIRHIYPRRLGHLSKMTDRMCGP